LALPVRLESLTYSFVLIRTTRPMHELSPAFTLITFWITVVLIVCAMNAILLACAYQILAERKIAAWTQDRLGPNRVGPWGLLQPIADGLKFLFKEEVIPGHVDKIFYLLAPGIAVGTALLAFAVVPFGRTTPPPTLVDRRTDEMVRSSSQPLTPQAREQLLESNTTYGPPRGPVWPETQTTEAYILAADRAYAKAKGVPSFEEQLAQYNDTVQFVIAPNVDIGIVWVFGIGSLAVYAIVLGGWSSRNKYSLIGGLRSSAQLISYEIPLGMSVLGVMLVTGSLNLERMIDYQHHHGWNVLFQPLACLLFVTCVFAECNRLPFDLPEAEQELVGGYHTEYSALKFGLFFIGEYAHMITTSFLVVALFFGGSELLPWVAVPGTGVGSIIGKLLVFAVKMVLFIIFYMLVRWTIPRFRFDQLMSLTWKVLIPLALINLVAVLVVTHFRLSHWWLLPLSLLILVGAAVVSLRLPTAGPPRRLLVRGHPSGQPTLAADHAELR
jgi:NADH-quinone oxidoreductase subunit H